MNILDEFKVDPDLEKSIELDILRNVIESITIRLADNDAFQPRCTDITTKGIKTND